MGSSISKVSCADITINKKCNYKPSRRHTVKIDKSKIGIPTDFRHTYHVGNNSPVMDEFADSSSTTEAASVITNSDFLATMAQITDALQKFPLNTTPRQAYAKSPASAKVVRNKKIGISQSDHQIARRPVSLLLDEKKRVAMPAQAPIEVSTSMIISSNNNQFDSQMIKSFSEKERNVLQISKSLSAQHITDQEHSHPTIKTIDVLPYDEDMDRSPILLKHKKKQMTTSDLTGVYYDFSSRLQSRIDAQIIELARARSKNKGNRSPRNVMTSYNKPAIMI